MQFIDKLRSYLQANIEDEIIKSGPFTGLILREALIACRNSSWDFPSFCIAMGIPNEDDEAPMHPNEYPELLTLFQEYCPAIRNQDLEFDT